MGVSDTNRPPNYALIYFMLSNINFVPKHGDLERMNWRPFHCKLLKSHIIEKITYMQWAKSEDAIIQHHKFQTNHTSINGSAFCMQGECMYFYIFWGPHISVCFSMYKFFLVGCPKGGWLATQSTPLGSAPASSHRYERPTKPNVYALCLTMLCCITDNAKPDLQNNNNYYLETPCSKESQIRGLITFYCKIHYIVPSLYNVQEQTF